MYTGCHVKYSLLYLDFIQY